MNLSFILIEVGIKTLLGRQNLPRDSSYKYTEESLSLAHATHMNTSASPKDVYLVTNGFVPRRKKQPREEDTRTKRTIIQSTVRTLFFAMHAPRSTLLDSIDKVLHPRTSKDR